MKNVSFYHGFGKRALSFLLAVVLLLSAAPLPTAYAAETETTELTEAATEASTESSTETSSEAPSEEPSTEPSTEKPTEKPTEASTETSQETETVTEAPTETTSAPTQEPETSGEAMETSSEAESTTTTTTTATTETTTSSTETTEENKPQLDPAEITAARVSWLPTAETVTAGETGTVILTAALTGEAYEAGIVRAEVQVALRGEDVALLDAAALPEGVRLSVKRDEAGNVLSGTLSAAFSEEASYALSFKAGAELAQPASLAVTSDDISLLYYNEADALLSSHVEKTVGTLTFQPKPVKHGPKRVTAKDAGGTIGSLSQNEFETKTWTVTWRDSDGSQDRHTQDSYTLGDTLKFKIGDTTYSFSEYKTCFGVDAPSISFNEQGNVHTISGSLPKQVTVAGEEDPKEITWSFTPPQKENYTGPSGTGPNFYYIENTTFTATCEFKDGSSGVLNNSDLKPTLRLYYKNEIGERVQVTQKEMPGVKVEYSTDGTEFEIKNLPRYDTNGHEIEYYVSYDDGELPPGSTENPLTIPFGNDGDKAEFVFDNSGLPNYDTDTTKLHNGGTVVLTLKGTTSFSAEKQWRDADRGKNFERPAVSYVLWRYRKGAEPGTAARVPDGNGFVELELANPTEDTSALKAKNNFDLNTLEKYDPDGYEYVYCVREEMSGTNADKYEQQFGSLSTDGSFKVKDELPYEGDRKENDDFLYNDGVLRNHLNEQIPVTGTKQWKAASFAGAFSDVTVRIELFRSHIKEQGTNVDEWVSTGITKDLDKFQGEHISEDSYSETMPRYDEEGHELKYEWREVAVYQGANSTDNLLREDADGKSVATLKQNNLDVTYKSESVIDNKGNTIITNTLVNEVKYDLKKTWEDGMEKFAVNFDLYQVKPNGQRVPYAIVKMDADGKCTLVNEPNAAADVALDGTATGNWHALVKGLPEFDENGGQYTYMILEQAAQPGQTFVPSYNQTYDPDTRTYKTSVHNAPGDDNRITIEKMWLDDSDIGHRGTVVIGVFKTSDGEPLKRDGKDGAQEDVTVELNANNGWYQIVNIGKVGVNDVFIKELKVGDCTVIEGTDTQGKLTGSYKNDYHKYAVTYSEKTDNNEKIYAVTNRRVGNEDIVVNKIWNDGNNEDGCRMKLKEAADAAGYRLVYRLNLPVGVTYDNAIQEVPFTGTKEEDFRVSFPDLPAYDDQGRRLHYSVDEVWVDSNNNVVPASSLPDPLKKLWAEYTSGQFFKEALWPHEDENIPNDILTVRYTNSRAQTQEIQWFKHWADEFTFSSGKRPDLYLDIYRVTYNTSGGASVPETVRQNYRWSVDDSSKTNDWTVTLSGMPKYDRDGYQYYYYAVERFQVKTGDFDYDTPIYKYEVDGELSQIGTMFSTTKEAGKHILGLDEKYPDVPELKGKDIYALESGGTFENRLVNKVTIEGSKVWDSLPSGYDRANLPEIQIIVNRVTVANGTVVDKPKEPNVASLTIKDWGSMTRPYTFNIKYLGVNEWQEGENGWQCVHTGGAGTPLPRYDVDGCLYKYDIQEIIIGTGNNTIGDSTKNTSEPLPAGYIYRANILSNNRIVNTYDSPKGSLKFQKHLTLPETPDSYPAITFTLKRSYTGNDGKPADDTVFEKKITWSSADVKAALKDDNGKKTANWDYTFTDLEITAPNGSAYKYTITETQLGGYDMYASKGDTIPTNATVGTYSVGDLEPKQNATDKDIAATFRNVEHSNETINISGKKVWDDKGNVLNLRPDELTVTLYRKVDSQPGQDNGQDWTKVGDETIQKPASGDWTYEFKGLDKYADNGLPWQYKVVEGDVNTITPVYNTGYTGDPGAVDMPDTGTIGDIKNQIDTKTVPFRKTWIGSDNAVLDNDYLGINVAVTFQLQVKKSDGTWQNAKEYFNANAQGYFDTSETFTKTLTGSIADKTKWSSSFTGLPTHIGVLDSTTNTYVATELEYRVIETKISYASIEQEVVLPDNSDKYQNQNPNGSYVFEPQVLMGVNESLNKLPTVTLKVTKNWDDSDNDYDTRPGGTNGNWSVTFLIQRSFDGNHWTPVPDGTGNLTVTINQSTNNATQVINELPKFGINGKSVEPYQYRAVELQPDTGTVVTDKFYNDAYEVSYTQTNRNDTFETTTTNTLNPTRDITAQKTWSPGSDKQDITLKLQYKNVKGTWVTLDSVTLNAADSSTHNWQCEWKKLPTYHPKGQQVFGQDGTLQPTEYQVIEKSLGSNYVSDTTVTADTWTIKNTEVVSVYATKSWLGGTWTKDEKPVNVMLYRRSDNAVDWEAVGQDAKGETVSSQELKPGNENASFTNLPKYDESKNPAKAYTYQVFEVVDGVRQEYATNSNFNVVYENTSTSNSFTTAIKNYRKTNITATKTWKDDSLQRPDDLSVQLYRRVGTEAWKLVSPQPTSTIWNNQGSTWTKTFQDLEWCDAQGRQYEYSVVETVPSAKRPTQDGNEHYEVTGQHTLNLTNTLRGTTSVSGTKSWKDDGNESLRPASITVKLFAESATTPKYDTGKTATANVTSNWTYSFTNLAKYDDNGALINYTVEEETVTPNGGAPGDSYKVDVNGYNITNTLTGTRNIPVEKVWAGDSGDVYKTRPASIEVELVKDGTATGQTLTLKSTNNWHSSFTNLARYDADGRTIVYTVKENTTLGNYTYGGDGTEANNFTITNTLKTTILSGTKTWLDDGNKLGMRPTSIQVNIMNGTVKVDTVTVEPKPTDSGNTWSYTISGLPKCDDQGQDIVYTVEETNLIYPNGVVHDDYVPTYAANGHDITNLLTGTEGIEITKTWKDNNNAYNTRPTEIQVNLLADDKPVTGTFGTAQLTNPVTIQGDAWKISIKGLPKYDTSGKKITYTVEELETTNYKRSDSDSLTITNLLSGQLDITVKKTWLDNGNAYKTRPASLKVELLRNGEVFKTALLTGQTQWAYTFRNLEVYDENGVKYTYTTREILPDTSKYVPVDTGKPHEFTNLLTDTTQLEVTKTWTDGGNTAGRAASVTVHLLGNGNDLKQELKLSAENSWTARFTNLPKYDNTGKRITYTVVEDHVPGYTTAYHVTDKGITVENLAHGSLTVTKKVTGSGGDLTKKFHFTVTLSEPLTGTYGDMAFTDGVATVTLKHNQSATATGLPAGIRYRVKETEANQSGYRTTTKGSSGTIEPNTESVAAFTNSKSGKRLPQTGQLTWPIPAMLLGGLGFLAAGLAGRKRKKRN